MIQIIYMKHPLWIVSKPKIISMEQIKSSDKKQAKWKLIYIAIGSHITAK